MMQGLLRLVVKWPLLGTGRERVPLSVPLTPFSAANARHASRTLFPRTEEREEENAIFVCHRHSTMAGSFFFHPFTPGFALFCFPAFSFHLISSCGGGSQSVEVRVVSIPRILPLWPERERKTCLRHTSACTYKHTHTPAREAIVV